MRQSRQGLSNAGLFGRIRSYSRSPVPGAEGLPSGASSGALAGASFGAIALALLLGLASVSGQVITLEAESGTLSGTMIMGADPAASGGHYVHVPAGTIGETADKVALSFSITAPGTYRIKTWAWADSPTNVWDDSFFVQVDGQPSDVNQAVYYVLRNTEYWSDYVMLSRADSDPDALGAFEVELSAGLHTIEFLNRIEGTRLDKIQIEPAPLPRQAGGGDATGPNVTLAETAGSATINNGIVSVRINKSNGEIQSLVHNGVDVVQPGGKGYFSWNTPDFHTPANCTYSVVTNTTDRVEIKCRHLWNGTTDDPWDLDLHYVLQRGDQGIYVFAVGSHPPSYPALDVGEWRTVLRTRTDDHLRFLTVDSLRRRLIPKSTDTSVAVPGAPGEVSLMTSGVRAGYYEHKYDYSADFGFCKAWGLSSSEDNTGTNSVWILRGSDEFYNGGPSNRELVGHVPCLLLNMFNGSHYGSGGGLEVGAGESWSKMWGPYFIYLSNVQGYSESWMDALDQAQAERAAWPYDWMRNADYPLAVSRSSVRGRLLVDDPEDPDASAAGAWVGLCAPPATDAGRDWQQQARGYQFWVRADKEGDFNMTAVRPGVYELRAFNQGIIGEYTNQNIVISAGQTFAMGDLTWVPSRFGSERWQIGIANRNAMEYRHGNHYWQYGLFELYPVEFPDDATFTIGESDFRTDWNYAQPTVWDGGTWGGPSWTVEFNLVNVPPGTAWLRLAMCGNANASIVAYVNGQTQYPGIGDTLGLPYDNAMARDSMHGLWTEYRFPFSTSLLTTGTNRIVLDQRRNGGKFYHVMYDCVRMELPALPEPDITDITEVAGTVMVRGTNGLPNGTYYVLSSPDVTLPISEWIRISTNAFDGAGNFTFSGASLPNGEKDFYRLLLP